MSMWRLMSRSLSRLCTEDEAGRGVGLVDGELCVHEHVEVDVAVTEQALHVCVGELELFALLTWHQDHVLADSRTEVVARCKLQGLEGVLVHISASDGEVFHGLGEAIECGEELAIQSMRASS